ncbi:hypothetical protein E2562_012183, partial [Oryza meyeriana var. granulata]
MYCAATAAAKEAGAAVAGEEKQRRWAAARGSFWRRSLPRSIISSAKVAGSEGFMLNRT